MLCYLTLTGNHPGKFCPHLTDEKTETHEFSYLPKQHGLCQPTWLWH